MKLSLGNTLKEHTRLMLGSWYTTESSLGHLNESGGREEEIVITAS